MQKQCEEYQEEARKAKEKAERIHDELKSAQARHRCTAEELADSKKAKVLRVSLFGLYCAVPAAAYINMHSCLQDEIKRSLENMKKQIAEGKIGRKSLTDELNSLRSKLASTVDSLQDALKRAQTAEEESKRLRK